MSRTRRTIDDAGDGLWAVVDRWAEGAVDPIRLRARWTARATPVRGVDHLVDVTGDRSAAAAALKAAGLRIRTIRPARRGLGRTGGVAYPDDEAVIAALDAADVGHRVVDRARRYSWPAPFAGPTLCEISTEAGSGRATIEAWHEPVWTDGFRLGPAGDSRGRPRRLLQARAAINELLLALGVDPVAPSGR